MKKTAAILLTVLSSTAFAHNHMEGDPTSHVQMKTSKSQAAKQSLSKQDQAYIAVVNQGDATVGLTFEQFKAQK